MTEGDFDFGAAERYIDTTEELVAFLREKGLSDVQIIRRVAKLQWSSADVALSCVLDLCSFMEMHPR